jgi:hypothetical protein
MPPEPPSGQTTWLTSEPERTVEAKVKTASAAAGLTALVVAMVQRWIFRGDTVPAELVVLITAVVSSAVAYAATWVTGYLTRHTPRALPPAE